MARAITSSPDIGIAVRAVPMVKPVDGGGQTGQVIFVVAVVAALAALARLPWTAPRGAWRLAPYTIGALAAFWTIERVVTAVTRIA